MYIRGNGFKKWHFPCNRLLKQWKMPQALASFESGCIPVNSNSVVLFIMLYKVVVTLFK